MVTGHTSASIAPGALLGVLGGGQLGAMFAAAARRLGYRVAVWDPDPEAPAHRGADRAIMTPFSSDTGAEDFLDGVAAVTYEWENVPAALCERLERRVPLYPASSVLRTIQHRGVQKRFLAEHGFPVAAFREMRGVEDAAGWAAVTELGLPCLIKTARAGYDGKGQWRVERPADLSAVRAQLSAQGTTAMELVAEAMVPFVRELSVLVVVGRGGEACCYPAVDNLHERGILRRTSVPAPVADAIRDDAQRLSESAVRALGSPGVYCVELFLLADGTLRINEIAPRPHNSGHYTLDACPVSQFEQQVRVLAGGPLGAVSITMPAVMINLLGDEMRAIREDRQAAELAAQPGVHVHEYGKRRARPGRKMGHVTVLHERAEVAASRAEALLAAIRQAVPSPG